ncbi:MAG TPA: DUF1501 domain-containing protein, partial [Planctomycetaceae bacterium]|nr:DUF1501 domain-containing protein [Planctomycetaceae bacterium]
APSHVDTFDYKPKLADLNGQSMPGARTTFAKLMASPWKFAQHGQSGLWISELFPVLAKQADELCLLRGMHTDVPAHPQAFMQMHTGVFQFKRPSMGAWTFYGLGTENENLPGFVVMLDPRGGPISGAKNWNSGYMPAQYEGTIFRSQGTPILDLARPADLSEAGQRRLLNTLREFNEDHAARLGNDSRLAARVASYELAFKMQSSAPEAVDLAQEPAHLQELYGLNDKRTAVVARQCLLARRLVERGVRFVQIYSGGAHNDDNWDAHGDLVDNHTLHAGETDKPIAALLTDLKARGLLDSTLIVWGGEFGRQPTAEYEKGTGRDHNAYGFTMWATGGGIRGGISVGTTDELAGAAVEKPFHVKHLHATILSQLGLDPDRLTYFYGGLDQKLVGVEGAEPIREIMG